MTFLSRCAAVGVILQAGCFSILHADDAPSADTLVAVRGMKPPSGFLVGPGAPIDGARQLVGQGGAKGEVIDSPTGSQLKLTFPAGSTEKQVELKPLDGFWDLTDALEVRVTVRNGGDIPVTPEVSVESRSEATARVTVPAALSPGERAEIVIPFKAKKTWTGIPETGTNFASNYGSGVAISVTPQEGEQVLIVESIRAGLPSYAAPDWLGRRPPVEGDWVQTLDEEFDGTAIDGRTWNNSIAENYWDKRSHFSRDNVLLGNGVVKLHYEKKTGHQADDPAKPETDYVVGYLDTFGKWVQRYGYFEARMKVPSAPGLWPAFWLMPDRGAAYVPAAGRSDTANGGMEFDIMEFLSSWGPCRYNIAMHWDGYGKEHQSTGSEGIYVHPDPDGYITAGLLWTPGSAIYYCNGKEVLRNESSRISDVPSYILLDMVSGGWDNLPLDDAKLPDDFTIDYVRVWQRKDLASDADGFKTPPPPAAEAQPQPQP